MPHKLNRIPRKNRRDKFQFEQLEPREMFSASAGLTLEEILASRQNLVVEHQVETPGTADAGDAVEGTTALEVDNYAFSPIVSVNSNASTSTGVPLQLSADVFVIANVDLSVQWTKVSGPGTPTFSDASKIDSTVQFDQPGTYALRLEVTNKGKVQYGTVNVTVTGALASDPIAPKLFDTTYSLPTGGTTHHPANGTEFQAAINVAQPGDVIVLQAGTTYTGNFVLPNKGANSDWIYIISSDLAALPEGDRVGPADASHMPKIVSSNSSPAIATKFGTNHYRLAGIEISTAVRNYNLVLTGYDGTSDFSNIADDTSELPYNITFDRCYLHSTSETNAARTGILANGKYFAVVDSYLENFKDTTDASAIQVWFGEGPYKFVNNFLEGTGENILIGGERNLVGDIPSDFEIRGNHFYKRPEWKAPDLWKFKNLFEIKCAQRVSFTGNVLEYSWVDGQRGEAIVLTPRNDGNLGDQRRIWDITIENNIIRHVGTGFNIAGEDTFGPTQQTRRILITNNLVTDVNTDYYGNSKFINLSTPERSIEYLTITNNTMLFADGQLGSIVLEAESGLVNVDHIVIENNIFTHGDYGIPKFHRDERMENLSHSNNGYAFLDNWSGYTNYYAGAFATLYPGNYKTATIGGIGFVGATEGNYRLAPTSSFKNAGTDGKDLGADINLLEAATDGVLAGISHASLSIPDVSSSKMRSSILQDAALFRMSFSATSNQSVWTQRVFQDFHGEIAGEREGVYVEDTSLANLHSVLQRVYDDPKNWEAFVISRVGATHDEKFTCDVASEFDDSGFNFTPKN